MSLKALITALPYRLKQDAEDELFRNYIADSIRLIPQNSHINKRYKELLEQRIDTRTGEEIVADIIARLKEDD